MKTVSFTITGVSNYSQSKLISSPKQGKETSEDHEERCWRERVHADENGHVFIPPMAIKNTLSEAAKFLSMQIPGKGKSTYTKHFETGVLCLEPITIKFNDAPINAADVAGERLFVPSTGKRGDGKRVHKRFPFIPKGWTGEVKLTVLDEMLTPNVLKEHLELAGRTIGIGRFRPRNNGYYGRFAVSDIKIEEAA